MRSNRCFAFVALCRRLDLFGRELLAVDGTRLTAVNSRKRNFTREKLAGSNKQADSASTRAAALAARIVRLCERREGHAAMLAELVASGDSQISLTDPDARCMATHPKVGDGYNARLMRSMSSSSNST